MAAGIVEPEGKAAGRVTITTTLTSLIPPFVAIFVVVGCALLEILSKETAGAVVLGILATAGLTTGTVYQTAKKTPTDQARTVWSSGPVADVVTPAQAPVTVDPDPAPADVPEAVTDPVAGSLADEVAAVRTPAHRA